MSWLGFVLLALGLYLAFKLVGALLKIAMVVLALVGAYWIAAPHLGWPTVSDLVYVFGPDLGGERIEELADPSKLAKRATDHVVDEVIERSGLPVSEPASEPAPQAPADDAAPQLQGHPPEQDEPAL
jgi:hypothetical protein